MNPLSGLEEDIRFSVQCRQRVGSARAVLLQLRDQLEAESGTRALDDLGGLGQNGA